MKLRAQPGYVVIKFTPPEEVASGHQLLESGIVVPEHVAAAQKEEITHLEHLVVGTSERSELRVGDFVITSKLPTVIEIHVDGEIFGIMPESEAFASYTPED